MIMSTQLLIPIDNFNFDKTDKPVLINTAFFRIKRNKKYYLITNHMYLPIKNNILLEEEKLKICINSIWNELLILKENDPVKNINKYNDIMTFQEMATRLPNLGSTLYINQSKVIVQEFTFRNMAFLDYYPEIVYIKVNFKKPQDILPGTPLYSNNFILQGIVSIVDDTGIYCLPSYYLLKTFIKENNFRLPIIKDNVKRINRYFIKNDMIFNPSLGINVPVLSSFLIEDNLKAYNKEGLEEEIEYKDSKQIYEIENRRNLVPNNDYYQLTSSAIHLLKMKHPNHASLLIKHLRENSNPGVKFKVDKSNLVLSS